MSLNATRWGNLDDDIRYFKLDGYHKINNTSKEIGLGITEARGDEDVFPCSLPWGEGTSRWRGVGNHEGIPNATKAHLLLPSLVHEELAHLLVVDFKVVSKPSQTFHGANHKPKASGRP